MGEWVTDRRAAELAANLAEVTSRIATAATAAGRDPREVTLIAVTKTWPAADVRALAALGVTDVGESRDQEAAAKAAELGNPRLHLAESQARRLHLAESQASRLHLAESQASRLHLAESQARRLHLAEPQAPRLTWHFVGALQTNKAASVARYADVVHSVDRHRLIDALAAAARAARPGRGPLGVLIQVNLDPVPTPDRGGASPADVPALADAVATSGALELRGLMLVAPPAADPAPAFTELAELSARLRAEHPQASWISAGMSGDLEAAVAAGATHVRVGSGLLGTRPRRR